MHVRSSFLVWLCFVCFLGISFLLPYLSSIVEVPFPNGRLSRPAILMVESQRTACFRCEVFPSDSLTVMESRRNSWCMKSLSPLSKNYSVGNEPQIKAKGISSKAPSVSAQARCFSLKHNTFQIKSYCWNVQKTHLSAGAWGGQNFGSHVNKQ